MSQHRPTSGKCSVAGKMCFRTKSHANSVSSDGMSAYLCNACGWFHLGHPDARIVAGTMRSDQARAERTTGVDLHAIRACPDCGGQGTPAVGLLHTARCSKRDADPREFPTLRRRTRW